MAEQEFTHENLQLVGRHVPDEWDGKGDRPYDNASPVTGFYEVGALIDGVFVPLSRRKAAGLFTDIDRARDRGYTPPTPVEPGAQTGDQGTADLEARVVALEQAVGQTTEPAPSEPAPSEPAPPTA